MITKRRKGNDNHQIKQTNEFCASLIDVIYSGIHSLKSMLLRISDPLLSNRLIDDVLEVSGCKLTRLAILRGKCLIESDKYR